MPPCVPICGWPPAPCAASQRSCVAGRPLCCLPSTGVLQATQQRAADGSAHASPRVGLVFCTLCCSPSTGATSPPHMPCVDLVLLARCCSPSTLQQWQECLRCGQPGHRTMLPALWSRASTSPLDMCVLWADVTCVPPQRRALVVGCVVTNCGVRVHVQMLLGGFPGPASLS